MITARWLSPLITGYDATGHVLADTEVTDLMDANNHTDDEGHGSPQSENRTQQLVSRGAARGEPEDATQSGNVVKGMFRLFCMFLPYCLHSTTIITSLVLSMCSGKRRKHGKNTQYVFAF